MNKSKCALVIKKYDIFIQMLEILCKNMLLMFLAFDHKRCKLYFILTQHNTYDKVNQKQYANAAKSWP